MQCGQPDVTAKDADTETRKAGKAMAQRTAKRIQPAKRVRWVSPATYAEIHGLHIKTVRRRLAAGLIPGAMQPAPGHAVRIPIADEAA